MPVADLGQKFRQPCWLPLIYQCYSGFEAQRVHVRSHPHYPIPASAWWLVPLDAPNTGACDGVVRLPSGHPTCA